MIRYEKIVNVIADIYEEYKIRELGFDIFKLCKEMGIYLIKYSQFEEKSELLESFDNDGFNVINPKNNHIEIYYNDKISPSERIYFTIPHELGHICLNHNLESMEETIEQRSEANYFANQLYCPRIILKHFNLNSCGALMSHFGITRGYAETLLDKYDRRGEIMQAEDRLLNIFLKNREINQGGESV